MSSNLTTRTNLEQMKELIIKHATTAPNMLEAARRCNLTPAKFRYHAIKLGVWNPNQYNVCCSKPEKTLNDLINHAKILMSRKSTQSFKLKNALLLAKMIENKCSECGIREWNNKPLNCHLDHIDGNKENNAFENLRMLCPNCHSQTETYTGRNKKLKRLNNSLA